MKTAQEQCSSNLEEVIRTIDSAIRDYTSGTTLLNRRNIIACVVLEIVNKALDNTFSRNDNREQDFLSLTGVKNDNLLRGTTVADKLSDAIDKSYDLQEDHLSRPSCQVERPTCRAYNSTEEPLLEPAREQCSRNLERIIRIVDGAVKDYIRDADDNRRAEAIAGVVMKIVSDALDNTFVQKNGNGMNFLSTSGIKKGDSPFTNSAAHYLSRVIRSSYHLQKIYSEKEK